MLILMFTGQFIFFNGDGEGKAFNLINPGDERELDRKKLDTICFHTFIIMNFFNMINCRVLDTEQYSEMNVFKTLCKLRRNDDGKI